MDSIQISDDGVRPFSEVQISLKENALTDTRNPRHWLVGHGDGSQMLCTSSLRCWCLQWAKQWKENGSELEVFSPRRQVRPCHFLRNVGEANLTVCVGLSNGLGGKWTDFLLPHHKDCLVSGRTMTGMRQVRHFPQHSILDGTKDSVNEINNI